MFTKGNKEDPTIEEPKEPAPPSLLSTDLSITGDVHSEGEIQIDGRVTGDIHTDVLIVGEKATVDGEINAESVRVHGTVTGQIKARSVSFAKTANVRGDILHENLAIEQGAYLEGHCRRVELDKPEKDKTINLLVKGVKSNPPPKKADMENSAEAS